MNRQSQIFEAEGSQGVVAAADLFTNVEKKLSARKTLRKTANPENSYYSSEESRFAAIARSERFQHCTIIMIVLNMLYLYIDADMNAADSIIYADPTFVILELFFAAFFTIEIAIRFFAFRETKRAFPLRYLLPGEGRGGRL